MRLTKLIASAFLILGVAAGQTTNTKQPQLKSEKEQQAVMAVFNAADSAGRIAATEALLQKFADSEFKSLALFIAAAAAEEAGDWEKTVIWGDRALEADKGSYGTMLILARGYAARVREFDLDKEEKLAKAEKYANGALDLLKTAPKIRPDVSDEQWTAQVKMWQSEAYEALGLASVARKKWSDAIGRFEKGLEAAPGNPNLMARMASAQVDAGKADDALATLTKLLAAADLNPAVKNIAENLKKRATEMKGAK
jgi:tetratricopeptide (TPR) repeat protein